MLVVGLTGNLGSGKTTVLKQLKRKGALVFDCDRRVHHYYLNSQADVYKKISALFPECLEKGEILRKKLSQLVFSDRGKLKRLETIVHPVIIRELLDWIESCRHEQKRKPGVCVAEVPLLFEKNLQNYFDCIVLIKVKRKLHFKRLNRIYAFSQITAQRRFSFYRPLREKIKGADFVIDNSGSLKQLEKEVDLLWKNLKQKQRLNQ